MNLEWTALEEHGPKERIPLEEHELMKSIWAGMIRPGRRHK